jgi:hypothetical protein
MNTKAIFSLSAILLGMGAIPAFAGEASVTNSYSWQNITNGYGKSNTTFHESYEGYRLAVAGAYKVENGYNYSNPNPGYSSTPVEKVSSDSMQYGESNNPRYLTGNNYVATSGSLNLEYGTFKQTTDTNASQTYNFTGGSNSHTVSSGFSY